MPAPESPNDLIDEREFAVPRELVFEAWTVPEHFAQALGITDPRGHLRVVSELEEPGEQGGGVANAPFGALQRAGDENLFEFAPCFVVEDALVDAPRKQAYVFIRKRLHASREQHDWKSGS